MTDKSVSALLEFLDWTSEKGIMAKNTVSGRKAAVGNVLGVLDPEEKGDVSSIDLDGAMTRFINLEGKKYNTSSLNVYKSRTNAAINDFLSYIEDPLAFRPHSSKNEKKGLGTNPPKRIKRKQHKEPSTSPDESNAPVSVSHSDSAKVFPIQIRENLVVRIHGLPFDLTPAEAERIASVVKAMAMK